MTSVQLASLILIVVCATGSAALSWEKLFVLFGDSNGLLGMPLTKEGLLKEGYSLMVHDEELNVDFYAKKNNFLVAQGVDQNGNIAGVRINLVKADIGGKSAQEGASFNYSYYEEDPMYSRGTIEGKEVYHNTILFTDPETLKAGGRPESASTVGENLYVKLDGGWTKMPMYECKAKVLGFADSVCFPIIGKHYFYGLSSKMDCMNFKGLMVMYEGGDLVGFGFTMFGAHSSMSSGSGILSSMTKLMTNPTKAWFNNPSSTVLKGLMPENSPRCLLEWINNYGVTTVHFLFSKDPRKILCSGKTTIC